MLNEGAILLNPDDKKDISKYLNDMKKYTTQLLTQNVSYELEEIVGSLQKASDQMSSNKFPFEIRYVDVRANAGGWYDKNIVFLNLRTHVKVSAELDGYRPTQVVKSVDFKTLSISFLHEFVHYVQDVLRQEKSGQYKVPKDWSEPKKYWKRPWEQQAYGIDYLERLRQKLRTHDPKALLNNLRRLGVLHNKDLHDLKTSDYGSWKAIMKQAIMAAIADVKEGEPLPWQKK